MATESLIYEVNEKGARVVRRRIEDIGTGAERAGRGVGLLVSALGAIASSVLLKGMFNIISANQQLEASLKTVTGGAAEAKNAMNLITDTAKQLPSSIEEITQGFIKLTALGLTPSQDALISYSNTASAMGKSLNQFIEAVADATTGEFERLKEFGIKSKTEGERIKFTFQGVTTEVGKNAREIESYLRDIGSVQFAGAASDQMDTLQGKLSLLRDEFRLLVIDIGNGGLSSAFELVINAARSFVSGIRQLPNVFVALFATIDKSIVTVQFSFKKLTASITFLWAKAINGSKRVFAEFLKFVAGGLDLIGADETAAGLNTYADNLKKASDNVAPLSERMKTLNKEMEKQKQLIDDVAVGIISDNLAKQNPTFTPIQSNTSSVSTLTTANTSSANDDNIKDNVVFFETSVQRLARLQKEVFESIKLPTRDFNELARTIKELQSLGKISEDEKTLFLADNNLVNDKVLGLQLYKAEYERSLNEIDVLRQNDVINEQQASRARALANAQYLEQKLKGVTTITGAIATLSNSSNKKVAEKARKVALFDATVRGFQAAQRAYAEQGIPGLIASAIITANNINSIRSQPTGFMTGGSFTVGGQGGADSQVVPIRATPGERVTVSTPEQVRRGGGATGEGGSNVTLMVANFSTMEAAEEWLDSGEADKKLLNRLEANSAQVKQIASNG